MVNLATAGCHTSSKGVAFKRHFEGTDKAIE